MAKVLILDQSKSVRNILRERLEYEGFSAEAVEDEAAATDICGKVPFDLIISDTGCKVPDAGIPFIALSTDASIDSAVKAVRSGAQDFLTKPIDMNRLLQSIHRTIANPATAPPAAAAAPVVRRSRRAHPAQAENIIGISAKQGTGLDRLCEALRRAVDTDALYHGDPVVSNSRHYEALTTAREALDRALDGLGNGLPADLLSEEIRQVIHALGSITARGAIVPDEVLQNIFSKFCIGK